jgi:hypothetical protein
LATEPTPAPNESLEMLLMNGFSEESGGVGGVKGVEMLREAVPDLPQGVSGASQISLKPAAGDTVETVDVDDKHEKFFGSNRDGELSASSFETDAARGVLPKVR